jgi:hypothetical protein
MRACNRRLVRGITKLVAVLMLVGAAGTAAVAEKIRGTPSCTTGSYPRTIGGKAHTCTSKCTTSVTETTCNPNCSTTVSTETSYGGCTADAASRPPRTHLGTVPPAGILETDRGGSGGGGRPGATGQPLRPPAATAPKIQ